MIDLSYFYNNNIRRIIFLFNKLLNRRPSSDPFVSGDSFRSLADYKIESTKDVADLNGINNNSIIFCQSDYLEDFFKLKLKDINSKFILITHNSDIVIDEKYSTFLESKFLIHWFALNNTIAHKKITSIPIGIENLHYFNNGRRGEFQRNIVIRKKLNRIISAFRCHTNPVERTHAMNVLKATGLADFIETPPHLFKAELSKYRFVASPPGNGPDCYRTWEAMYLGTVPIVIGQAFYSLFPNFPGLVLDSWEELFKFDDQLLDEVFNKHSKFLKNTKYLWMSYWRETINQLRNCGE